MTTTMPSLTDLHSLIGNDPYPWYDDLRTRGPVAHVPEAGLNVVTSHEAVTTARRDPPTFSSATGMSALVDGSSGSERLTRHSDLDLSSLRLLIASDPPDHTRLRRASAEPSPPERSATSNPASARSAPNTSRHSSTPAPTATSCATSPARFPSPSSPKPSASHPQIVSTSAAGPTRSSASSPEECPDPMWSPPLQRCSGT